MAISREDSLEKTLMLGKCEGKRKRGQQRMRWLDSVIKATNMNLTKLREAVEDNRAWCALVHGITRVGYDLTTKQQSWLDTICLKLNFIAND